MKNPCLPPIRIAELLAEIQHLGATETGILLRLLMHYWQNGAIPREDRQIALIAHVNSRLWHQYKETILAFFEVSTDERSCSVKPLTKLLRSAKLINKNNGPISILDKNGKKIVTGLLSDNEFSIIFNDLSLCETDLPRNKEREKEKERKSIKKKEREREKERVGFSSSILTSFSSYKKRRGRDWDRGSMRGKGKEKGRRHSQAKSLTQPNTQINPGSPPLISPQSSPKVKATLCPSDWTPAEEHYEKALGWGWDRAEVDLEAKEMREWSQSHSNHLFAWKVDWNLRFSRWLKDAHERWVASAPDREIGWV